MGVRQCRKLQPVVAIHRVVSGGDVGRLEALTYAKSNDGEENIRLHALLVAMALRYLNVAVHVGT